jgi:hypothetical protein
MGANPGLYNHAKLNVLDVAGCDRPGAPVNMLSQRLIRQVRDSCMLYVYLCVLTLDGSAFFLAVCAWTRARCEFVL